MTARIIPWPGCVVRVEDLPWAGGGWLVSYWHADRCLAIVEVRPWDRTPITPDG